MTILDSELEICNFLCKHFYVPVAGISDPPPALAADMSASPSEQSVSVSGSKEVKNDRMGLHPKFQRKVRK